MTSGLLYLAIVGVWAVVLVPMWVRRSDAGDPREGEPADAPPAPRGPRGQSRARVVARRRRRLTGIATFFVVTLLIAATGLAPWWIVPVPGLALAGFLACLRAAALCDADLAEREWLRAEEQVSEHEPGEPAGRQEPEGEHKPAERSGPHAAAESAAGGTRDSAGEEASDPHATGSASLDSRVIDFPTGGARVSGRAGARDELFDQYADPPRRAAGD